MITKISKLLLCSVCAFAWSCGGCDLYPPSEESHFIEYVNDSSHDIEIEWGADYPLSVLPTGTSMSVFVHFTMRGEPASFPELQDYLLRFDGEIEYSSVHDAESDYAHLLSDFCCYESNGNSTYRYIYTYTYTFTDADYDYAVEHGVAYDPE